MTANAETETRPDSYYAGAYWGPRRESPEECAKRLGALLAGLSETDPSLARWFQQGKSRKDALNRPLGPNVADLEAFVRRGKDRTFDELGFSVGGWNGAADDYEASGFLIACGGYSEWVNNRCVFTLPRLKALQSKSWGMQEPGRFGPSACPGAICSAFAMCPQCAPPTGSEEAPGGTAWDGKG
ncbi:Imm52 family immunity protein [Pyxidicoccus sp. 3LG]